jgi:hypothetical protein
LNSPRPGTTIVTELEFIVDCKLLALVDGRSQDWMSLNGLAPDFRPEER